jgi:hypothetical protein
MDEETENTSDMEETENASDSSHTFGSALDHMLEKSSTPDDMPGPGRVEHLETIAGNGAPMSAEQLDEQLPDILYPPDDLLEAVAEWMSVDPQALRQGDVQGFGGSGSTGDSGGGDDSDDDGSGGAPGDDMPEPTANDNKTNNEKRRLLESNVRLEAENKGLELDDETADQLTDLRQHAPEVYETMLHNLVENADDTPIDEERGTAGGAGGNPTLRQLCEQAQDKGIERGSGLLDYIDDQGYEGDYDPSIARDVYGA